MKERKRFEVIECEGTLYEIGVQWGKGCKENISKALEMALGGLSQVFDTTKEDIIFNAMKYGKKVQNFDHELIDIMRGQAEGAGVKFEEIFTLKCAYDLGAYYKQVSALCTSFAARGVATRKGNTFLGQTIDWYPGTPMDLLKITYPDGTVNLSLVLWGVVEYTLSSAGLGMCANGTWSTSDDFHFNIPLGCYLSKAMRQKTWEEALDILRKNARGLGYFLLASKNGEITGIESVQNDFENHYPEEDILVHSNHYLTERFQDMDLVNTLVPDSPSRLERIKILMEDHYGYLTPQLMMEILSDHDNYPNSLCRHVDETKPPQFHSQTLAAYIMVPEEGLMYIAWGNPCQHEFVEYKMD
ncbi:MAG: hypothetical protein D5R97_00420 [Candidatus Syntrophonatronum acetioxidans]|uniref:Peptidase C45 hydrolase domain-containing protein n=1 Tax=Candidatus Syntrophonatronum acetioxidans TaxID=1795816 RepID=A0A424YIW8_9FIRM|nr:MAG: hypothetical protein D5R97_00420 [Candidatus Syntrophonatronum acetioxidans]